MQSTTIGMDNALAASSDEDLVRLAREAGSPGALATLVARHYLRMRRLVDGWGRKEQLSVEDRQDLGQKAYFFLLKTVRDYRDGQSGAVKSCRFRTFLGFAIQNWFRDAVRRLRRQERRIDRSIRAEDILKNRAGPRASTDPVEIGLQRELWECLDAELFFLDAPLRRIWEEQELGHSLNESARALAGSYDHVKRLRQKMFDLLRRGLKEEPA